MTGFDVCQAVFDMKIVAGPMNSKTFFGKWKNICVHSGPEILLFLASAAARNLYIFIVWPRPHCNSPKKKTISCQSRILTFICIIWWSFSAAYDMRSKTEDECKIMSIAIAVSGCRSCDHSPLFGQFRTHTNHKRPYTVCMREQRSHILRPGAVELAELIESARRMTIKAKYIYAN